MAVEPDEAQIAELRELAGSARDHRLVGLERATLLRCTEDAGASTPSRAT